jgi:hypothetical protein
MTAPNRKVRADYSSINDFRRRHLGQNAMPSKIINRADLETMRRVAALDLQRMLQVEPVTHTEGRDGN